MGGTTVGMGVLSYLLLKTLVVPKLNAVCVRTLRMQITQDVLVDVASEDHQDDDIRGKILDNIDRAGIPRQDIGIRMP